MPYILTASTETFNPCVLIIFMWHNANSNASSFGMYFEFCITGEWSIMMLSVIKLKD